MKSREIISNIDSIWDIGANHGQFAFMANKVWPDLPIYSFEPDPISYAKLQQNFNKFSIIGKTLSYALSDKVESKQLMRYADNVNNSLLINKSNKDINVRESLQVECTTLDVIFQQLPDVRKAFLKLDVQGFELMVLKGAEKFLQRCSYIQIEVSFSPTYDGGAHAGEIILAMRNYGFECIEIIDLLRDTMGTFRILEADLLFKKSNLEM